jgi:hypothetical protein
MNRFRVLKVDLFTGTAGALARMPHQGERKRKRDLCNSEQVCGAALRARAPAVPVKASNHTAYLEMKMNQSREE